jgi:hypothetical protein
MDPFLREYVPMGLTDIAVLEESFEESEAGYGSQKASATIVARKGDGFVKMSVSEYARFGFNAKRSFGITSEEAIPENVYRNLSNGKDFIDNSEDVWQVQAEQAALRRRYELEGKLNEAAPKCPVCGDPTTYKSGSYGPFWGCPKYPDCNGTVRMSREEKRWYNEWAGK